MNAESFYKDVRELRELQEAIDGKDSMIFGDPDIIRYHHIVECLPQVITPEDAMDLCSYSLDKLERTKTETRNAVVDEVLGVLKTMCSDNAYRTMRTAIEKYMV